MNKFLLSIACVLIFAVQLSAQIDKIKGKVLDRSGKPVPGIKISVDGGQFYQSNDKGAFSFTPPQALVMPFEVTISKKGYKLDKFVFDDSENEIEVTVKKSGKPAEEAKPFLARIYDQNGLMLKNLTATIDNNKITSDAKGNFIIKLESDFNEYSKVELEGYTTQSIVYNEKEKWYKITVQQITEPVVPVLQTDTVVLPQPQIQVPIRENNVFSQYRDELKNLTNEIIAERVRLEGNNKKIRDEIISITSRLHYEKKLSKKQRKELAAYVTNLEHTLIENTRVFEQSQQRTTFLIEKLQSIILEKDSINAEAIRKIELVQKEKMKVERKAKRNLIVFSIITVALLILAMVFYGIAVKMRKQRKEFMKINENYEDVKKELAEHKTIIAMQKKQLEEYQNR